VRLFQQKLGESGNTTTIVVENRAGAAGVVGTDAVANAAPDGYTVLVGNHGVLAMLPHLQKLPYDQRRPIMMQPGKAYAAARQVYKVHRLHLQKLIKILAVQL